MANTLDATSKPWFRLDRFDADPAPETEPQDPAADDPAGEDVDDEGTDQLGDKGKQALDRMKAERNAAKKEAADAKRTATENARKARENADKAKKFDELEAANKTEAEKLTAAKDAAEQKAAAAVKRAVTAEVKSLADDFADREDAVLNLGDLAKYVDAAGDIDTDAIKQDLADVLDRKKHLRKAPTEAPKPPKPKPDPGQGKTGDDKPTDFRTADDATFKSELAKMGIRPRS